MLRVSWRGLLSHTLRLALSAVAVVLGVAFVAGSYIFTDTLQATFTQLYEQTSADVTISPASTADTSVTSGTTTTTQRVPAAVVAEVARLDGVARAQGEVQVSGVRIVDPAGGVLGTTGAPGIGVGWTGDPSSSLTVVAGRAPERDGEVAVDTTAVADGGLRVGDTVTLVMPRGEPVSATLVGTVRFGESGNLAGATLTAFDLTSAQMLFTAPGQFTGVSVTSAPGAAPEQVAARVEAAVGGDYAVETRAETVARGADAIAEGFGFLGTLLLAFAGVALFVGSFIIVNTFAMIVAQRTRELALLRALGASRGQVTRSVLGEAAAVGVSGSVLGVAAGAGIAFLLQRVFGRVGFDVATDGLVIAPRTVLVSLLVGILVTLVAAYLPARRAGRVPPAAALQGNVATSSASLRRRTVVGAALAATGLALLVVAATVHGGTRAAELLGAGAALTIVGVMTAGPAISSRVLPVLTAPMQRLRGEVGRLAVENAVRNPRRTSATASALMVGLALVGAFAVLAASLTASVDRLVDSALGGSDMLVADSTRQPFSPAVAEAVRDVDGVGTVIRQRYGPVTVGDLATDTTFAATDPIGLTDVLAYTFVTGSTDGLDSGVILDADRATAGGWQVGDLVPVATAADSTELVLTGIYRPSTALGPGAMSLTTYETLGGDTADQVLYVQFAAGADTRAVAAAVKTAVAPYPQLEASSRQEFATAQRDQVGQILSLVYALLALAIVIAVLGIVNTLALSVVERTREIGLLRAVGMSRRQLRSVIRWESVVIAIYGAVLGLGLGVLFGAVLQQALADQGITSLAVPWVSLGVFLVLAGVVGVLAALWPARRAARLDVLRAVTAG